MNTTAGYTLGPGGCRVLLRRTLPTSRPVLSVHLVAPSLSRLATSKGDECGPSLLVADTTEGKWYQCGVPSASTSDSDSEDDEEEDEDDDDVGVTPGDKAADNLGSHPDAGSHNGSMSTDGGGSFIGGGGRGTPERAKSAGILRRAGPGSASAAVPIGGVSAAHAVPRSFRNGGSLLSTSPAVFRRMMRARLRSTSSSAAPERTPPHSVDSDTGSHTGASAIAASLKALDDLVDSQAEQARDKAAAEADADAVGDVAAALWSAPIAVCRHSALLEVHLLTL